MTLPRTREAEERFGGQALVEFALIIPLLFVLLLGIFEAGRFVLYQQALNNAAREGARYAIVHGARGVPQVGPLPENVAALSGWDKDGATIQATVEDAAIGLLDEDQLEVPAPCWQTSSAREVPEKGSCPEGGNNARGSPVTVWVDYTYDPLFRELLGLNFLPTITISVESTYVVNN